VGVGTPQERSIVRVDRPVQFDKLLPVGVLAGVLEGRNNLCQYLRWDSLNTHLHNMSSQCSTPEHYPSRSILATVLILTNSKMTQGNSGH